MVYGNISLTKNFSVLGWYAKGAYDLNESTQILSSHVRSPLVSVLVNENLWKKNSLPINWISLLLIMQISNSMELHYLGRSYVSLLLNLKNKTVETGGFTDVSPATQPASDEIKQFRIENKMEQD